MSNLPGQKSSTNSSSNKIHLKESSIPIDYLRSFIIILAVFFQAALACTSFSIFIGGLALGWGTSKLVR
jgi:hypothetical protein